MLVSMVLEVHRDVGVAVRQAEVEGCDAEQFGVDGVHKLSQIIKIYHEWLYKYHFTAPFHFDNLSSFTALIFPSTHCRCFTSSKQIFHIKTEIILKFHTHSMMQIFNPKQRAALALTKCYHFTSLTSDSTRFGALHSAPQMTTSLKLTFTPSAFIYCFEHFAIKIFIF